MGKYFGTDGFRGEANVNLTVDHAFKIGKFLGWYFGKEHRAQIAIGKDTRGMCRKCAEKTVARMRYLLFNEFTEAQREVLNDAFDGVALTEPDKAKVILP